MINLKTTLGDYFTEVYGVTKDYLNMDGVGISEEYMDNTILDYVMEEYGLNEEEVATLNHVEIMEILEKGNLPARFDSPSERLMQLDAQLKQQSVIVSPQAQNALPGFHNTKNVGTSVVHDYTKPATNPQSQYYTGWQGGTTGWQGGNNNAVVCRHDADKLVFRMKKKGGLAFYAADSWGAKEAVKRSDKIVIDYVLDCGNILSPNSTFVSGSRHFAHLNKYVDQDHAEIIKLAWHDFGTPPAGFEFWRQLLLSLPNKQANVMVCCMGGHGRTGTALSSLLIAYGWQAQDAIKFVRKVHCNKAVETKDQERYLEAISQEGDEFERLRKKKRKPKDTENA